MLGIIVGVGSLSPRCQSEQAPAGRQISVQVVARETTCWPPSRGPDEEGLEIGLPAGLQFFRILSVVIPIIELFADYAYLALFILSFLASTIVPIGSEWFLIALVVQGYDPLLSLMIATVGNTFGACTTYAIGLYGGPFLIARILRISDKSIRRAERFYGRYGRWSLLFSWVPVAGDPLCLVGGILRVRFLTFVILVLVGKLARYALVIYMALTLW